MFERGATVSSAAGIPGVVVNFAFPRIGLPRIATNEVVLEHNSIWFDKLGWGLDEFVAALGAVIAERLVLLPTGGSQSPVSMVAGTAKPDPFGTGASSYFGLSTSGTPADRQLYDVGVKQDDGSFQVLAPHAVYYRSAWNDFGVAHVTDIHVARRIEYFADRLTTAGRADAAQNFANWNDRFRGFIKYANYLHDQGLLDVVMATGDIIDYQYENADDQPSGGNAWFVRQILLGEAPSARVPDVEELRVPIFVAPGNHDYRKWPYFLMSKLDLGALGERSLRQYSGYKLSEADGLIAQGNADGAVPTRNAEHSAEAIEIDRYLLGFKKHLADQFNYTVELGSHRIVMLDSGPDYGLPDDFYDALSIALGDDEDGITASTGSPNSEGVSSDGLRAVTDVLADETATGLVIVGLHAPLFNPWNEEYPWFLRESQRPAQRDAVYRWLNRQDADRGTDSQMPFSGSIPDSDAASVRSRHPSWFAPSGDPDAVSYVKRGDHKDFFDWGVSRGEAHGLLKAAVGIDQRRGVDVVLHGHVHRYNEWRLAQLDTDVVCFFDFYTRNPPHYYPTPFGDFNALVETHDDRVAYVDIVADAPANNQPAENAAGVRFPYAVTIPPYPTPLETAPDAGAWWSTHRPLVLQAEALGPFKNVEADLAGFRVLTVRGDVITRIDHVAIERLVAANYQLDWQQAIATPSRRFYFHAQRSKEFAMPESIGAPSGFAWPATGGQSIQYRDSGGQYLELWRDTAGQRGTGNLTGVASAPRAIGDPSCYLDTGASTVVMPYRGEDGGVHTMWATSGTTGHDALSGSIGAPGTDGDPRGFYNPANNNHHVVYRSGDHIHVLYWAGAAAAGHEDLTGGLGAPPAQGNPFGYLDTTRGVNIVLYRSTDDHIRSIYWSDGPAGLDDLSGFTGAPAAAGDPRGVYLAPHDSHYVVYRGADGHIHLIEWVGEAAGATVNLTASTGAPTAAGDPSGDPSIWSTLAGDWIHVVYRDAAGKVQMIHWQPGGAPAHANLCALAYAPTTLNKPYGYASTNRQHVVYQGSDKHIQEIYWS